MYRLPDTTPYDENAQMDCDDLEPVVYPVAVEVCDGLDNDCDTLVMMTMKSQMTFSHGNIFYLDADGDGFGDFQTPHVAVQRVILCSPEQ